MKTYFDTSVLVASMEESHSCHARARAWLERARAGEFEWCVSSHTLAELYSVLTVLPVRPRITGAEAMKLVSENVLGQARVISLSAADYEAVLDDLSRRNLVGGIVYDALHAKAAEKAGSRRLLTFNVDDFRRVWPSGANRVTAP